MGRCTANDEILNRTSQAHNGRGLVAGVVQLLTGTISQAGIWETATPEELGYRNSGRTDRINNMVAEIWFR